MASNEDYLSLSIKRQALLERVKSGQVRDFAKEIKGIETLIRRTLLGLDEELSTLSQSKFNKLLSQLRADQLTIYNAATATFLENAATIAGVAAAGEIVALEKTVDLRGTKLNELTKKQAFSKVLKRPMTTAGQLMEPWIKDFSVNEVNRVNGAIRNGWATGKTNQEMVQQLIGTKSKNYKDGILQTTRRNASTVVRTSVQHTAITAQYETLEANQDVVKQYQIVATLDGDTSAICRELDGEKFDFGKGPIPPIHPNCRTDIIPVLDSKFDFISKGRTRSAEDGPTSAKATYYDWLKRQDEATQIQVLGPKRAKLFRDGGMSAKRFKDLQFDKNFEPLTLDEMQKIEPEAFKRAGLTKAPTTTKKPVRSKENIAFDSATAPKASPTTAPEKKLVEVPGVQPSVKPAPAPAKLSRQEVGEVEYYKGDGFYENNKVLLNPGRYDKGKVQSAKNSASRLDDIIKKNKTTKDHTFYRGIRSGEMFDNAESLVGKTLQNVTTQSTTYDEGVAKRYAGLVGDFSADKDASVLLKVRVKKGSSAMNVSKYTDINSEEKEILLTSTSKYRVASVENKGQYKIITVDYEE